MEPSAAAATCPFCGTHEVSAGRTARLLKPQAVLPFKMPREEAVARFRRWIAGLWFAPNTLAAHARNDAALRGLYVPCWTYDCSTATDYSGERGDDHWVTLPVVTRVGGRTVTRMRQVRRTRWSPAAGSVRRRFDDVLVVASTSLPRALAEALDPWDLGSLVPYRDEYLSGFQAEEYQVGLAEGLGRAKEIMDATIRHDIRADIGGDHQRIHHASTSYSDLAFKHVLVPIWVSAYRFRDRAFRFLINGRTGEVQGERPWSIVKIALAAAAAAAAGMAVWLLSS